MDLSTIEQGLLDGLLSEVKEETGLNVTRVAGYVNAFDYTSGSGKKTRQFNFFVETSDTKETLNPDEHAASLWSGPSDAAFAGLNLSTETRNSILLAAGMIGR